MFRFPCTFTLPSYRDQSLLVFVYFIILFVFTRSFKLVACMRMQSMYTPAEPVRNSGKARRGEARQAGRAPCTDDSEMSHLDEEVLGHSETARPVFGELGSKS